jgi:hypothetical protein
MDELVLGMLLIFAIVVLFLAISARGFVVSSAPVKSTHPTIEQLSAAFADSKKPVNLPRKPSELDGCGWDGQ